MVATVDPTCVFCCCRVDGSGWKCFGTPSAHEPTNQLFLVQAGEILIRADKLLFSSKHLWHCCKRPHSLHSSLRRCNERCSFLLISRATSVSVAHPMSDAKMFHQFRQVEIIYIVHTPKRALATSTIAHDSLPPTPRTTADTRIHSRTTR